MYSIGYLLTDDVGYGEGQRRIDWIMDNRYKRGCSNATYMEKYDGNVAVGDLLTEDPREAALSVLVLKIMFFMTRRICCTNELAV
jgi:hypothetical protein